MNTNSVLNSGKAAPQQTQLTLVNRVRKKRTVGAEEMTAQRRGCKVTRRPKQELRCPRTHKEEWSPEYNPGSRAREQGSVHNLLAGCTHVHMYARTLSGLGVITTVNALYMLRHEPLSDLNFYLYHKMNNSIAGLDN